MRPASEAWFSKLVCLSMALHSQSAKHIEWLHARNAQEYSASRNNNTDCVYPMLVPTHNRKDASEPYRRNGQPEMKNHERRDAKE